MKKYLFTEDNRVAQVEFLLNRLSESKKQNPKYEDLNSKLTGHVDGVSYLVPMFEEEADFVDLLENSKFYELDEFQLEEISGAISQCHENSMKYVLEDPENRKVMTGYALSEDHLWRQHSWIQEGDTIIETTEPRLVYFGYEATRMLEEFKRF